MKVGIIMASLNIMKMKAGALKGLRVHLDTAERLSHEHSNKHIDKSKTSDNFCINCNNYKDGVSMIEGIIKNVDKEIPPKRIRTDRVTSVAIEFKIPKEITDKGLDKEFAKKCVEYLKEKLGVPEIIAFGHVDEKHSYIDPLTHERKESLNHVHAYAPCYTKDYGINAKNFFGKDKLNYANLNREFDDFVKAEFGISYMTSNDYIGVDVESLKKISEAMEVHDDKLIEELGMHKSIIKEGKAPEVEVKSALGNYVKLNSNDYDEFMKDAQYARGAFHRIKKLEKEKNENEKKFKAELEALKNKYEKYIKMNNSSYEEQLNIRNKSIKLLCEKQGLEVDKVMKAIELSRAVGHENAYKKAINQGSVNRLTINFDEINR